MLSFLDQLYKQLDSNAEDKLFVFYVGFQKSFDTVHHHSVVDSAVGIRDRAKSAQNNSQPLQRQKNNVFALKLKIEPL